MEFKIEVLNWMFEGNEKPKSSYMAAKNYQAEGYEISRTTLQEWVLKKELILNSINSR